MRFSCIDVENEKSFFFGTTIHRTLSLLSVSLRVYLCLHAFFFCRVVSLQTFHSLTYEPITLKLQHFIFERTVPNVYLPHEFPQYTFFNFYFIRLFCSEASKYLPHQILENQ